MDDYQSIHGVLYSMNDNHWKTMKIAAERSMTESFEDSPAERFHWRV